MSSSCPETPPLPDADDEMPSQAKAPRDASAAIEQEADLVDLGPLDETAPPAIRRGVAAIREAWKTLPMGPGVYRMLGGDGEVLYVGKAKSLKKRVASYTRGFGHSGRTARMIA